MKQKWNPCQALLFYRRVKSVAEDNDCGVEYFRRILSESQARNLTTDCADYTKWGLIS
jgi:hypothetical protein